MFPKQHANPKSFLKFFSDVKRGKCYKGAVARVIFTGAKSDFYCLLGFKLDGNRV